MPRLPPLILVVDDEADVRFLLADLLEDEGFAVAEAANAESALRVLAARPNVEVLFTDLQMPGAFGGLELVHRAHMQWPRLGLLLTSGRVRPSPVDIPSKGRLMSKPYPPGELLFNLKELIAKA